MQYRALWRVLPLLAWIALLSYWSGRSSLPIDRPAISSALHGTQQLLAHLAAFAILAALARWALDGLPRSTLIAVLLTAALGALDEWRQSYTPGRTPDPVDWLVDTLAGVVTAPMIGVFLDARRRAGEWPQPVLVGVAVATLLLVSVALATALQTSSTDLIGAVVTAGGSAAPVGEIVDIAGTRHT